MREAVLDELELGRPVDRAGVVRDAALWCSFSHFSDAILASAFPGRAEHVEPGAELLVADLELELLDERRPARVELLLQVLGASRP